MYHYNLLAYTVVSLSLSLYIHHRRLPCHCILFVSLFDHQNDRNIDIPVTIVEGGEGGKPSRLPTVTPYKNMGLILNNFKKSARLFLFFFIFLREDRGGGGGGLRPPHFKTSSKTQNRVHYNNLSQEFLDSRA